MDVSYLDVDPKVDAKSLTLEHYNDRDYGYVRVEATPEHLAIGYYTVGAIDSARSPPRQGDRRAQDPEDCRQPLITATADTRLSRFTGSGHGH